MANQKITDLTEKVTLASDDLFEIVDTVTGTNKKVKSTTVLSQVNTWFVNPSAQGGNGSPQKPFTVDEAMAAASEGDIIIFQAGTYTADITVTKNNLTFVGQAQDVCKIDVTNFVIDTDAETITFILDTLTISTVNGLTQGSNPAIVTFQNITGSFSDDIIIYRIRNILNSRFSTSNITTQSFTTVKNSTISCTTWEIDGTSEFEKSTISGTIEAATRTLTFNTCDITGDVNCANLNIKNTVITGTKVGTSSTTVNNQEVSPNFGPGAIKILSSDVAASGSDRNLSIAAQSGADDDMIELTGLTVGQKVLLRADTGDTITVKHNAGGATIKILITNNSDLVLDEDNPLELILVSTNKLAQTI